MLSSTGGKLKSVGMNSYIRLSLTLSKKLVSLPFLVTFILESKAQKHTHSHKLCCLGPLLLSAVRFNYVQLRFPLQSEKCIQYSGLNCRGFLFSHFCLFSHYFSASISLPEAPQTKGIAIFIHLFPDYSLWGFSFTLFSFSTRQHHRLRQGRNF